MSLVQLYREIYQTILMYIGSHHYSALSSLYLLAYLGCVTSFDGFVKNRITLLMVWGNSRLVEHFGDLFKRALSQSISGPLSRAIKCRCWRLSQYVIPARWLGLSRVLGMRWNQLSDCFGAHLFTLVVIVSIWRYCLCMLVYLCLRCHLDGMGVKGMQSCCEIWTLSLDERLRRLLWDRLHEKHLSFLQPLNPKGKDGSMLLWFSRSECVLVEDVVWDGDCAWYQLHTWEIAFSPLTVTATVL